MVHFLCKALRRIPAQNIYVVRLNELIGEFFLLNRSLRVAFRPKKIRTFSEDGYSRMLGTRGFDC